MKTKMPTGASKNVSLKSQSKDTHFLNETQILFKYLQQNVASCTMACIATGLLQKNATRYKRKLEMSNQLWVVYKKLCTITHRKVSWITTNPELCQNSIKQLCIPFEEGES